MASRTRASRRTMPARDFALIATLKARGLAQQRDTRKSELLRAGVKSLAAMSDNAFLASLHAVPAIKTGRPKLPAAVVTPVKTVAPAKTAAKPKR